MSRWHRMGYPPRSAIMLFLILVAGFDLVSWGIWMSFSDADPYATRQLVQSWATAPLILIGLASVLLGGFRLIRYPAPTRRKGQGDAWDYGAWLSLSPYASGRCPFGPWHPIWFDIVPLSVLGLLLSGHVAFWNATFDWGFLAACFFVPTIAFMLGWMIGGLMIVWRTWRYGFLIIACTVAAIANVGRYTQSPTAVLICVAAVMIVAFGHAWIRLGHMLRDFTERSAAEVSPPSNVKHAAIGHYSVLSPTYRPELSWGEGGEPYRSFAGACLLAILAFLCTNALNPLENSVILAPAFALIAGMVHVFFYSQSRVPHLGFAARWTRRRFVVPDFDRIFALPLVVLFVTTLLTWTRLVQYIRHPLTLPTLIAMTVFVLVRFGPDYRTWSLTAPCRHLSIKPQGVTK